MKRSSCPNDGISACKEIVIYYIRHLNFEAYSVCTQHMFVIKKFHILPTYYTTSSDYFPCVAIGLTNGFLSGDELSFLWGSSYRFVRV